MHGPDCTCKHCDPPHDCTRCGAFQHGGLTDRERLLCDECVAAERAAADVVPAAGATP